jgi:siroheme synthase
VGWALFAAVAEAARRARLEGPATLVVGEVVGWSAAHPLAPPAQVVGAGRAG